MAPPSTPPHHGRTSRLAARSCAICHAVLYRTAVMGDLYVRAGRVLREAPPCLRRARCRGGVD